MKFPYSEFWKHERNIDVFFKIENVISDDGTTARLRGCWCTQGIDNWWFTINAIIEVSSHEYDKWTVYFPTGHIIL